MTRFFTVLEDLPEKAKGFIPTKEPLLAEAWGSLLGFADTSAKGNGAVGWAVFERALVRCRGSRDAFLYRDLAAISMHAGELRMVCRMDEGVPRLEATSDTTRLGDFLVLVPTPVPREVLDALIDALAQAGFSAHQVLSRTIHELLEQIALAPRDDGPATGDFQRFSERLLFQATITAEMLFTTGHLALDAGFDPLSYWGKIPGIFSLVRTALEIAFLNTNQPVSVWPVTLLVHRRNLFSTLSWGRFLRADLPIEVQRFAAAGTMVRSGEEDAIELRAAFESSVGSGVAGDLLSVMELVLEIAEFMQERVPSKTFGDAPSIMKPVGEEKTRQWLSSLDGLPTDPMHSNFQTLYKLEILCDLANATINERAVVVAGERVPMICEQIGGIDVGSQTDDMLLYLFSACWIVEQYSGVDVEIASSFRKIGQELDRRIPNHPLYVALVRTMLEDGAAFLPDERWDPEAVVGRDHSSFLTTHSEVEALLGFKEGLGVEATPILTPKAFLDSRPPDTPRPKGGGFGPQRRNAAAEGQRMGSVFRSG